MQHSKEVHSLINRSAKEDTTTTARASPVLEVTRVPHTLIVQCGGIAGVLFVESARGKVISHIALNKILKGYRMTHYAWMAAIFLIIEDTDVCCGRPRPTENYSSDIKS
jgi:hypothetical protein